MLPAPVACQRSSGMESQQSVTRPRHPRSNDHRVCSRRSELSLDSSIGSRSSVKCSFRILSGLHLSISDVVLHLPPNALSNPSVHGSRWNFNSARTNQAEQSLSFTRIPVSESHESCYQAHARICYRIRGYHNCDLPLLPVGQICFQQCSNPREPLRRLWLRSGLFAVCQRMFFFLCSSWSVVGQCCVASCVGRLVHSICVVISLQLVHCLTILRSGTQGKLLSVVSNAKKLSLPSRTVTSTAFHLSGHGAPSSKAASTHHRELWYFSGWLLHLWWSFFWRSSSFQTENAKNALVAFVTSRPTLETGQLASCRHVSNARHNTQQIQF